MNIVLLDASGCGVTLIVNETKQYIATEGYPHKYKPSQNCYFHFIAPRFKRIIVFFEDFSLEAEHDLLVFRKLHTMDKHMYCINSNRVNGDWLCFWKKVLMYAIYIDFISL